MKILLITSLLLVAAYGGQVQKDDLQKIIETVNKSGAKWKAGQNFAENTKIDSLKKLMGLKRDKLLKLPLGAKHSIPDSSIPDSFDARENWPQCDSIRHIRDQGTCGSCWAVAAAGAFTDRVCIATNGTFTKPLSSEELLACCSECGNGCNGGYPFSAWKFFAYNGLVTGGDYQSNEGCQPYEIQACEHHTTGKLPSCDSLPMSKTPKCQRKCTNAAYSTPFSSDHHKIKQVYTIDGVKEIQKEIMAHGPVEAGYTVYADFPTYKSGVYHHVTGKALGGHAVKIIGWGVEDGTPYWLIANQWNESWGDKGLFKIIRGKDHCGIESEIVAGIPKL
ncbi:cathepsin B [Halyomorpha halys]|uniref:cathepsin B n=1 Tax=Halyomorpha halys TaxID=286706 RepID=UPI0006D4CB3A|nr:cathepsin B-like [Halyomorpha halys]